MQFLMIYILLMFCMFCMSYIFTRERAGDNWHLTLHPFRDQLYVSAFYIPPTFVIAYLLYPFKIIKRSRVLIWILLGYTILVVGGVSLLLFLLSFSNM